MGGRRGPERCRPRRSFRRPGDPTDRCRCDLAAHLRV